MKGRIGHFAAAGLGATATLVFLRDWLASGAAFLIGLALIMAGGMGYAAWCFAEVFAGLWSLRNDSASEAALPVPAEIPVLSKSRAAKVRQIVAALATEGVFQPEVPRPAALYAPVAERDDLPDQEVVLTALFEADYYDRSFQPARYTANLAFHGSKGEQFEEVIAAQIADLARLCGAYLPIAEVRVVHELVDGTGPQPACSIGFVAGAQQVALSYIPAAKYLSTVIHVAIAQALRATGSDRRLAWLWCDQGVWIAALAEGAVERLNAASGAVRHGFGGWDWIDLAQPVAVGEP